MSYQIRAIMDWWKQFNKETIKLSTDTQSFQISIKTSILPHLIGLQYILEKNQQLKGLDLFYYCYEKSDEEIFELIRSNNVSMLQNFSDRIDTFQYFMENLLDGKLVENTNKNSSIRSQHFIIEHKDNKTLHLGLLSILGEDAMIEYGVIDKKLETYILAGSDNYYKGSNLYENIISIEKYDEYGNLEPFSFKIEEECNYNYGMDI